MVYRINRRGLLAATAGAAFVSLVGCGDDDAPADTPGEDLTLRLGFAGASLSPGAAMYTSLPDVLGFWGERRLTVEITESGLIEDLGAAMGLPRVRDAHGAYLDIPRYARTMCAVAAAAAGVEALDTVYTDIADLEGLRRECEDGVAMGFSGKISIHPGQITVINEAFTPDSALVAEARELVALFEAHRARGAYAFRFKGQMVDAPHLTRARKLIERAGG